MFVRGALFHLSRGFPVDPYLLKHLKDAWRGDLTARRHVLAWLRTQGHAGLAAVIEPALSPSVVYPDAWTLDQLRPAASLTEASLDEIMPWRSPEVAAAALARRLEEASCRPWEIQSPNEHPPRLIIRPPAERRDAGGGLTQADRLALANVLRVPAGLFKHSGMTLDARPGPLRGYLLRAEGREVQPDPTDALSDSWL
jgi:hypothetical protein